MTDLQYFENARPPIGRSNHLSFSLSQIQVSMELEQKEGETAQFKERLGDLQRR